MLVKIREKSKGFVAYFLVGLIALAFSLWGMDSLFTSMRGDPNEIAKVNKESISQNQVEQVAQQQLQRLQQQEVDLDTLDMNWLRQMALGQLIQTQLLNQAANSLNMRISDYQLERHLVRLPIFQDAEGRFDLDRFTLLLQQQGLSPHLFRAQLRQDLLNQQLLDGLAGSEFYLDKELEGYQKLVGETRDYRYKIISAQDYLAEVEVSTNEIATFYQQQQMRFQTPERLQVAYVIFDPSSLIDQLDVSAARLEAEYESYLSNLRAQQNNYSAAHILLTFTDRDSKNAARERLEEARAAIIAGASFAELAAEISEDLSTARQGGNLGRIQPGSLDSNFERALFALENQGDISAVVETDFGWHLIQLTEKQEAELPSFASVRDELESRVQAQLLRSATSEKLEELRNLSFSAEDLAEVATTIAAPIELSPWLVRDNLSGWWAEPRVANAVFAPDLIQQGWLTEPISLNDGRYLIAARDTYEESKQQSLAEVEEQIVASLKSRKAADLANVTAKLELEMLQEKRNVGGQWETLTQVERFDPRVTEEINRAAFRLHSQEPVTSLRLAKGDTALIELGSVTTGSVAEITAELSLALQENQGYLMQNRFMQQLERRAKILVH